MVDQAKQAQANAEQKLKHSNQTVNKQAVSRIPYGIKMLNTK
jgi:hypothetical protein